MKVNNVIITKEVAELEVVKSGKGYYRPPFRNFVLTVEGSKISIEYYHKKGPTKYFNGTVKVLKDGTEIGNARITVHPYNGHIEFFAIEPKDFNNGRTYAFDDYCKIIKFIKKEIIMNFRLIAKANKCSDDSDTIKVIKRTKHNESTNQKYLRENIMRGAAGKETEVSSTFKSKVNENHEIKNKIKNDHSRPLYKDVPEGYIVIKYERRGHYRRIGNKKVWIKPCTVHRLKMKSKNERH